MHRLVILLFLGPFWVQLAIAAVFGYFSVLSVQSNARLAEERIALAQSAPPALIPIADVQKDKDLSVQEVHLSAVIATDHNTRLVKKTNFITTDEDLMYVLQDETAAKSEPLVRAVILLEPDQLDAFSKWVMANATGFTDTGPVVALNGLIADSRNSSHVSDVFRERGLKRAENFVYLEPFIAPRAEALAALPKDDSAMPLWLFGITALFVLIGLFKWRMRGRKTSPRATAEAPAPIAAQTAPQAKPGTSFGPGFAASEFAQARQTPTAAEIKALAAGYAPASQSSAPARQTAAPVRKGSHRVIFWLLAVPAGVYLVLWAAILGLAGAYLPKEMEFGLQDALPLMGGSALLILLPLSGFLILRNTFRGLGQFIPKSAPSAQAAPQATIAARKDSPIETVPPLGKRIGGVFVPQKLLDWAPLAVGVVIMFLVPMVMRRFGVDPILGMGGTNTAPALVPTMPNLAGSVSGGLPGIYLGTFGALLVLVALYWGMRHGITWGAKQIDPDLKDPWARIESERMRLG